MPYYLPPDYLDNTEQRTLAETLARLIGDAEQRQLDVATGYFEPSAWRHLRDAFPLLQRFRLLLGKETEPAGQSTAASTCAATSGNNCKTNWKGCPSTPNTPI
jgi:hypothetical protein